MTFILNSSNSSKSLSSNYFLPAGGHCLKMNSLSSVETKLPPGFRFHPRDEELICDYLMKRVTGCTPHHTPFLIEVDLNKCEPWDIPEIACVGGKDWYFYSQRDRKYATGLRTNRATFSGYWKATGKDRPVIQNKTLVGMRKTLVFYQGRAPKGRKTDWVMHEFRLDGPDSQPPSSIKEDWVLCKVFYKNTSDQVPAKQDVKSTSSSSSSPPISLPPLMEPYITFDQIQANYYKYHQQQQVSCFSILNSNQTGPSFSLPSNDQIHDQELLPTKIPPNYFFGGLYNHNSQLLNPNCDKNVIKAVLDHLTKMESCNDNILGEAISDTSNLSDYGLSSMWEDCRYDF